MLPIILIPGPEEKFRNYARAVEAAGGTARCSESPADARGCAGLVLPGGGDLNPRLYGQANRACRNIDDARDARELALLRRFAALRLPVLGICRGAQLLNVGLGGTLEQDVPNHDQVNGIDRLHPAEAEAGSQCAALYGRTFTVNSAHHQAAGIPGGGLRFTVRSADGIAEALEHETLPLLGVQWHPERLAGPLARPGASDGAAVFRLFLAWCRAAAV
jgi:putative glutamine amidotransferase